MIKKSLHILFYWLPTILWMVIIFQGSAATPTHVPGGKSIDFLSHKIAHFIEYLVLYFLWLRSLRSVERVKSLAPVLALFLSVFYAFSDEFHQLFVSGREGKLLDTAVDIFAVLIGWKCFEKGFLKKDNPCQK
ncbi:MAG: VanZ family protein [bacterium]|nr:VanZ family protein [bacterium]